MNRSGCSLILLLSCLLTNTATAQTSPADDPVESARIQLGPLGITPSGAINNIGVDSNVFNDVESPQRDFTFTVSPQVDAWFRAGRSLTSMNGRLDLVYFQRFASERSVDGEVDGRVELRGNRITPWLGGGMFTGRQRVGYEIDLRSRRTRGTLRTGVDLRLTPKSSFVFSVQRVSHDFAGDSFLGVNLRDSLTHLSRSGALEYRFAATVYTTLVVNSEILHERFVLASERNSNSVRLVAGADFDERALVGGRVRVGYRRFSGLGAGLPDYSGAIASFVTGFSVADRTEVEFAGDRDIEYSFERTYPYYVITGGSVTLTPRLTDVWDIQARAGGRRLAYRTLVGSGAPDRLDRHVSFGAGVGYHFGREVRLGFNVDRERRGSPLRARDYTGYRIGTSVTYGR